MEIGFIGLGRMGYHMAKHIAGAGHSLTVYDLRTESAEMLAGELPNVRVAGSVSEAAREAELVFTSLPGPPEVEAIVLDEGGLLGSMQEGATYVDLSTNSPTLVRRLAADLAAKGITMLDAPVSGGVEGAEAGTLSIMVGGDEATFESLRPVLGAIGTKLFYCGGIGNGSVTKLCNNICSQVIGMISSEALTLGVKAGVDVATLQQVISQSTGSSSRISARFPRYLLKRNFEPGFSIALSAKDTHLALDLAHELDVPMQAGEMAGRELDACIERGWANMDIDILPTLQEERAGVQLKLPE
ncbi:MAG: NAD(P)-dependent oxidoreductase [Dehalococcoidia bacterium]